MKFAIPVAGGILADHFGHSERFAIVDTDSDGRLLTVEEAVPPPHAPGAIPRWLKSRRVEVVIAGGMGPRASELFEAAGIRVLLGAPREAATTLVAAWHAGSLAGGPNACDHDSHDHHDCAHGGN